MAKNGITTKQFVERALLAGLEVEGTMMTTFERGVDRIVVRPDTTLSYKTATETVGPVSVSADEAALILRV